MPLDWTDEMGKLLHFDLYPFERDTANVWVLQIPPCTDSLKHGLINPPKYLCGLRNRLFGLTGD